MFQPVSLMPCLHVFCGACFSDWLQKSKECPHCRLVVKEVKKNAMVNSLIENFLAMNPELKKGDATRIDMEKKNIFTMELVCYFDLTFSLWLTKRLLSSQKKRSKSSQFPSAPT